ncbi:acetyl-CoA synthetase [Candidatus Micrarchaeota archaeon RBG_16_49_10]|nr:MAG: acetyl-CoA synthetase [Candidatus Micrarchaeota archaeon RBG_16_49_10]
MRPSEVFEGARREGRSTLTEPESREILKNYKIPLVEGVVVKTFEEADAFAERVGYPLVIKVVSRDITHKTDVGGVVLDIKGESELKLKMRQIILNVRDKVSDAAIGGIFVQRMVQGGTEVIVGGKEDPTFGKVLLFGMGGIYTEVLKDTSFRVVPISRRDAIEMIEETKAYQMLKGLRGKKAADIDALADVLVKVSKLLEESIEVKELDLNPVFAMPDGAVAVDARIVFE